MRHGEQMVPRKAADASVHLLDGGARRIMGDGWHSEDTTAMNASRVVSIQLVLLKR